MSGKPDLRTMEIGMQHYKTIPNNHGVNVDMYLVWQEGGAAITVGVPEGRGDIASFIQTAMQAGQRVLRQLPEGASFTPDLDKIGN